ncbi:hypothetical protein DMN91_001545 [Ooceraea biroi]|uniref:Uncharacterized protein n=1 Tax=Ooceraea biroi TaxID=2015173 RepID=A0A3L8DZN2_OOCBI|nr:hypothetical protein DMN91_001545 [Ooceraea biroi]
MGYYCASGDTNKVTCSSEEEGYENHSSGREKRDRVLEIFGEIFAPVPLIPDDTDRQFWAEDELSNSESRQKLIARRKRRHSTSYRNRTANRSRSQAPHTSSSSSDSTYAGTSRPKIRRMRRYCRYETRLKPETKKASHTRIEETPRTMNEVFPESSQVASTSGQQSTSNSQREVHQVTSSRANHQQRASDAIWHVRKAQRRRVRDKQK